MCLCVDFESNERYLKRGIFSLKVSFSFFHSRRGIRVILFFADAAAVFLNACLDIYCIHSLTHSFNSMD